MKYTLKTIKQTKVYQANIEAVRAVFPGHEEDFARELMIAANKAQNFFNHETLELSFLWVATPQGFEPWWALDRHLTQFVIAKKEQTKND